MDDGEAVRAVLARHEAWFNAGEISRWPEDYRSPVAVFLPDGLRIEQTTDDTVRTIAHLAQTARRLGAVRVRHAILALTPTAAGRVTARVTWDFLGTDGILIRQSELRYYFARRDRGPWLIEMLEYLRVGFPEAGNPGRVTGSH